MAVDIAEPLPTRFVAVVAEPEAFGCWVQAAPFRAHLLYLMGTTGLPWRVLAQLAGAAPRSVLRLLNGRDGRPVRRIDPLLARRLYALTADEVQKARRSAVDPERAMAALAELMGAGHDLVALAGRLRLSADFLLALHEGRRGVVSRLVEAQLRAAAEAGHPSAGPCAALSAGSTRDEEAAEEDSTAERLGATGPEDRTEDRTEGGTEGGTGRPPRTVAA